MIKVRSGYWLSIIGAGLSVAYLLGIIAAMLFDSIPPHEPYQTIISAVSLISVPIFVLLWVCIEDTVAIDRKIFAKGSLALIIIFGVLTSINRYVSLTVVPQAIQMGVTEGLDWFMPYGWPSIMAAVEVMAWGFYLGLAFFCLAPAFTKSKLERAIFWILIMSGILCLIAALGQMP